MMLIGIAFVVSVVTLVIASRYKLHPFFALLLAGLLFGLIMGKPIVAILAAMQAGFGSLLQQIGFLVAIGSCLGIVMEKTGAMAALGSKIITAFGPSRTVLAMSVIGVLVGIPVFCDSGFIILSRLIPALTTTTAPAAPLSLALATGLYTTHTLVPPTPGPLAAAANLGATPHLAVVMLIGLVGSMPVAGVAYLLSKRLGMRVETQLHSEATAAPHGTTPLIFLPLVVPIFLIALATLPALVPVWQNWQPILHVVGNPAVALTIGLLLSAMLIRGEQKTEWPKWISEALKDAGIILLITGAGGAFGSVIKSTGLEVLLKDLIGDSNVRGTFFLCVGFALAALLKTAQGSSTSAIIITSSLLAPLTAAAGFTTPVELATLVLAVGGGAMAVSHANDSYFWVVSQFGGIPERAALKSFTPITFVQGITALITAILISLL